MVTCCPQPTGAVLWGTVQHSKAQQGHQGDYGSLEEYFAEVTNVNYRPVAVEISRMRDRFYFCSARAYHLCNSFDSKAGGKTERQKGHGCQIPGAI